MHQTGTLPRHIRLLKQKAERIFKGGLSGTKKLDGAAVLAAYARWAPIYDYIFAGPLFWGRRAAVKHVNQLQGHVLEAGIGTGMSLPLYGSHLKITGIDLSEDMLKQARAKAAGRDNVDQLQVMDAADLSYPDGHFDVVVAMFVITVVPDPEKVIRELERVTKPGGTVIFVNHFSAEAGLRLTVERALKRFGHRLGWNPDFPKSRVLDRTILLPECEETLPPFKLFTLLRLRKPD
ncbi:phosphatidylethanolamine N-methyltransferase [Roseibium sp. TrichSKD4]|uniref:class I SAM-dependent methyltransferase n=1 Tax=Roseibium sp. TrichSKD4 TaxID=744980 RepID=UPI0001E57122|nr:class I SAM-dependent methyltransferase [Roseibium sp. TrichSKD4]EFO28683.1 phosphatidylethanolamine N-methyltransferase [Roseibium sp. TrichSKD4]